MTKLLSSVVATLLLIVVPAAAQMPEWISQHEPGSPGVTAGFALTNTHPYRALSDDGSLVLFTRDQDGGAGLADVYVRDRLSGETELISVAIDDGAGDARSVVPTMSGDGRFVVFSSYASNIVEGDTNGNWDVFMRDRLVGETRLVSRNRFGGAANGGSFAEAFSHDGSTVIFRSTSSDIVPEPPTFYELYVHDLATSNTMMLTLGEHGDAQGASFLWRSSDLSADGRRIVFSVEGDGMVAEDMNGEADLFLLDRDTDEVRLLTKRFDGSSSANGMSFYPCLTPNGRFMTFISEASDLVPNDFNRQADVFWLDLESGEVRLVSVNMDGEAGSGANLFFAAPLDRQGRFVAFSSTHQLLPEDTDGGLVDVYGRDMLLERTFLVSAGEGLMDEQYALFPFLTPDGSRVTFTSNPVDELEPSQTLTRRLTGGPLQLVSQRDGVAGDGDSSLGFPTPDGREVLFYSEATNLGGGGDDDLSEVFIARLPAGDPIPIPVASTRALATLALLLAVAGLLVLRRNVR